MTFRGHTLSLRDLAAVGLPILLAVAGAFWLAYQFVKPAPPGRILMSTS